MAIDTPKPGAVVSRQFSVGGWALEQSTCSGSGVDAIHVWAYTADGSAPVLVGSHGPNSGFRSDVAAVFDSQYFQTAFGVNGTLPAGRYDIAVFARSATSKTFSTAKVVRITVQ